ncbi:S1C family serine protease [Micromonospora sp. HM134]|uniref:S1C family serine protease n=1 Tax=Micromonospora sp. HM134 TaxID=2583243 RepID=UPI001F10B90B|nr:trypsin-like peptidase domain-containing protein [Micromonospora sp. HM134]
MPHPDTMLRPTPTIPAAAPPPPSSTPPWSPPPPPPSTPLSPPSSSRWRRRLVAAGTAVVLMVAGGGTGALVVDRFVDPGRVVTGTTAVTPVAAATIDSLATVVAVVSPSIVTVEVTGARESSLGSGVVLDTDGLVLTNQHVVDSGGRVTVTLADGRTAPATVVAQDAAADVALLRATGLAGLTPATLGSDTTLTVGDTVLAFGSPLGLAGTVTSGIVSALDRSVDGLTGLVQTDAAINHGNSGGALVDTAGRVVGINVAIATTGEDEGSVGLGFAIPVDTVREVVARLDAG